MGEMPLAQSSQLGKDVKEVLVTFVDFGLSNPAWISASSRSGHLSGALALIRPLELALRVTALARLKTSLLSARGPRDVSLSSCLPNL